MPGSFSYGDYFFDFEVLSFFQVIERPSVTPEMLPTWRLSLVIELFAKCLTGLASTLKAEAFYEELGLIIAGA